MSVLLMVTIALWGACAWLALSAWGRSGNLVWRLRRLLTAAVVGLTATAVTGGLLVVRVFDAFAGQTLVAQVLTVSKEPDAFEILYTSMPQLPDGAMKALPSSTQRIRLRGDQWIISGGIIKWHPWLTALGLKSYHKPMRLAGQFSQLDRQVAEPPTVHALHPEADRIWEAFYHAAPYLPFIEAVYGSGAYVYAEPGVMQEVYVTPSGYMIKRAPSGGPPGF